MAQVVSKKLIERVKQFEEGNKKENVTFRLNKANLDEFRLKCKKSKIPMGKVIEELIKEFLRN